MSNGSFGWDVLVILVVLGLVALVLTWRPRRRFDEQDREDDARGDLRP